MSVARLRMIAGPNGSGKSTFIDYLRAQFKLPLGYCQNPDLIDRELGRSGRLDLGAWGLQPSEAALRSFLRNHPLWSGGEVGQAVSVEGSVVVVASPFRHGYMAAILCDFMRRQWLATGQTFTFETVMSSRDKIQLLDDARQLGYRTYL